jgi:DNA-binding CsgD family transcriptional regulator/PAS domain-containing protein
LAVGIVGARGLREFRSEQIYEALFDDDAFEQLPQDLAEAVGARSAILNWAHNDGGFQTLGYCHFTPGFMQAYTETWAALDPWIAASRRPSRLNRVSLLEEIVPSAAYGRSAIYNDFVRPSGDDTFYTMGVAVSSDWGDGIIGVNRGRSAGPFEATELARLRPLAKDVGRVLKLRGEIAAARRDEEVSSAALDAMAVAIVIVTWNGRLLEANEAAEAVFERADGFGRRAGMVATARHADAVALEGAIAVATAGARPTATSVIVSRGAGLEPYLVTVSPLESPGPGRRAMLIFRDPATKDPSLMARLRGLFGLSRAEAEIAADLSEGRSPAEVAARRMVSANTLKTQLASLMGKMGCTRQSEVVSIVAALPRVRGA